MYIDFIIKPLEKEIKEQRLKVRKKRFSLTNDVEIEYLNKLKRLLDHYYKEFGILINKELK